MKALVRKELRENVLFLIFPAALLALGLRAVDLAERFYAPQVGMHSNVVALQGLSMLIAAFLGVLQIIREERRGTVSYLAHREASPLLGKALAGLLLAGGLAFVPPLGAFAVAWGRADPGVAPDPTALVEELCFGTAVLTAYAGGLFAGALGWGAGDRLAVAFGACAAILFTAVVAVAQSSLPPSIEPAAFVSCAIGSAVALIALAGRRPLELRSPWIERSPFLLLVRTVVILAFVTPLVGFLLFLLVGVCAGLAREELELELTDDGSIVTQGRAASEAGGRPSGVMLAEREPETVLALWRGDGEGATPTRSERVRHGLGRSWTALWARSFDVTLVGLRSIEIRAWLDRGSGCVRALLSEKGAETRTASWTPDGGALSEETLVIEDIADSGVRCSPLLFDPRSRRAFEVVVRPGEWPRLARVHPPGGDALVGWKPAAVVKGSRKLAPSVVLLGEEEEYWWVAGSLLAGSDAAETGVREPGDHHVLLVSDGDLLDPSFRLLTPGGAEIPWAVSKEAGTAPFMAVGAYAGALLNSPLAFVRAHLSPPSAEPYQPGTLAFDLLDLTLVRGGRRPWLLVLDLALVACLVVAAGRRLAWSRRTFSWGLVILATGPAGYVAMTLVEPWRAWVPREPRKPRALVVSAPRYAPRAAPSSSSSSAIRPASTRRR